MRLKKGLVHIYTGNGKGKTTAAFGLALRASGAGCKVYICQFVKGKVYNEIKALRKIKNIKVEQFGTGCFIRKKPSQKDAEWARKGLLNAEKNIQSGKYDVVMLDEINIALYFGLITAKEVLAVIDRKPGRVELVLTGRYAPQALIKRADLVTEMREVKHPYQKGIKARPGIEY